MTLIPILRTQFVTIHTRNLEASRRFYVDLFQFPVLSEKPGDFVQVEIAGVPICIDLDKAPNPVIGKNQIGVQVADLPATIAILRQKGLEVTCGQSGSGETWASVTDPDGHELIFIAA